MDKKEDGSSPLGWTAALIKWQSTVMGQGRKGSESIGLEKMSEDKNEGEWGKFFTHMRHSLVKGYYEEDG